MASETKNGYVLMLDVLGFRESATKSRNSDFFKTWSKLKNRLKDKQIEYDNDNNKNIRIDVLCLSDTVIVGLSYKSKEKGTRKNNSTLNKDRYLLSSMTHIIDLFLIDFMVNEKVFFRGVIGFGEFRFSDDNDIVMGTAIDEVSCWYEHHNWIGITLAPSAQYALEYILSINDRTNHPKALRNINNRFLDYGHVPTKDEKKSICHYAFCWYKRDPNNEINKANYEQILELFSQIKHEPVYAGKYDEAIKFVKHCLITIGNIGIETNNS